MTARINCGFARVFLWETKLKTSTCQPNRDVSVIKQKIKILDDRFGLYSQQFQDYEHLKLDKGKEMSWLNQCV